MAILALWAMFLSEGTEESHGQACVALKCKHLAGLGRSFCSHPVTVLPRGLYHLDGLIYHPPHVKTLAMVGTPALSSWGHRRALTHLFCLSYRFWDLKLML